jgi:hypothetical protein
MIRHVALFAWTSEATAEQRTRVAMELRALRPLIPECAPITSGRMRAWPKATSTSPSSAISTTRRATPPSQPGRLPRQASVEPRPAGGPAGPASQPDRVGDLALGGEPGVSRFPGENDRFLPPIADARPRCDPERRSAWWMCTLLGTGALHRCIHQAERSQWALPGPLAPSAPPGCRSRDPGQHASAYWASTPG